MQPQESGSDRFLSYPIGSAEREPRVGNPAVRQRRTRDAADCTAAQAVAAGQEQRPYERLPQLFIPDDAPLDVADDTAEIGLELG